MAELSLLAAEGAGAGWRMARGMDPSCSSWPCFPLEKRWGRAPGSSWWPQAGWRWKLLTLPRLFMDAKHSWLLQSHQHVAKPGLSFRRQHPEAQHPPPLHHSKASPINPKEYQGGGRKRKKINKKLPLLHPKLSISPKIPLRYP